MEYLILILGGVWIYSWFKGKTRSNKYSSRNAQARGVHTPKRTFEQKKSIPVEDIELTDEFKTSFDLMENSRKCIFITGKAGTGKSTLLRYFRAKTQKNVVVLAPTGIAAIHVDVQTIHSFFKFPPTFIQKDDIKILGRGRELLQKIDTIVIDEISMVRADLLDGIDHALQLNRSSVAPFGGAQLIFIGDLLQLPPVVKEDMKEFFDKKYDSPYFFSANVIKRVEMRRIELTHIFRQKDPEFISLLNNIRDNTHNDVDLNFLNKRIAQESADEDAKITLTPTNEIAARINAENLAKIDAEVHTFSAIISGEFKERDYPNEFHLVLKKSAQIMMIKNDAEKKQWFNGNLGHIEDVNASRIKVNLGGNVCEVLPEKWDKIRYLYNAKTGRIETEVIGSFSQFPIKLAWAMTIHKSQGQTFENVVIDMGNGAFAHGQVYVALSRCKTLNGIRLRKSISYGDIIFDRRVLEFNKNSNKTLG